MWVLECVSKQDKFDGPTTFWLPAGEWIVGRGSDADVMCDKSVSRKHGKITIKELTLDQLDAVGIAQEITVEDFESKFGTRVS